MESLKPIFFDIIIHNATEGIMITNEKGIIIFVNPSFTFITGYPSEEAIGKKSNLLKSDRHPDSFYQEMWETLSKKGIWAGNIWNRKKNGPNYLQSTKIVKIEDIHENKIYFIALFNDITQLHSLEEKSEQYTNYDFLTGLPNRFLFQDHLILSLIHAKNQGVMCAVFSINVDRFQHINNSFGYLTGDLLLIDLAQRIKELLTENETLYRIGADHFAVVAHNVSQTGDIFRLSQAMIEKINQKLFFLEDKEIASTISIGISIFPTDAKDIRDLIQNSETSMRSAKAKGGNQFQLYQPEMNLKSLENLILESKLRKALEKDEFVVFYQPQINIENGALIGAEALIRWKDPEQGLVPPSFFLPLSEELGLISSIGEWVLETACAQLKKWQKLKPDLDMTISVNIAAQQFRNENLVMNISKILQKTGLESKYLEVEITESATVDDINHVIQVLNQMNLLGIKIAIDDFGTGYSSLNYLKNFPLHKLKIDKSFIFEILADPKEKAIVDTIITLAKNFGLQVIAEGVELDEQIELLKSLGCYLVQGFCFSKPISAEEFEEKYLFPGTKSNDTNCFK